MKHFINIADFTADQLGNLLDKAAADKRDFKAGKLQPTLARKVMAMIFEKPSLRTRVSFEAGMVHLGGSAIYLAPGDIGLGSREPVQDVARVLASMCDVIMARTFSHQSIEQLARFSDVPVINALSDYSHPCQAMADIMTAIEAFGPLEGKKLAFVGDGNNVARSLAVLCAKLGVEFAIATPGDYRLEPTFLDWVRDRADGATLSETTDPAEAIDGAQIVYTDTWVSMGQEDEKARRVKDFDGFQVSAKLMSAAADDAIVMHCLPAYRGYEIDEETFEAHSETIIRQAENRLHLQRSLVEQLVLRGGLH
ncbi:MAG: ornithine carbamoyltransferase [Planctomycetota bacterium]